MAQLHSDQVPLTADDFARLPVSRTHELVDGEVRAMAPVGGTHGRVQIKLGGLLDAHATAHDLGDVVVEVGFRLDDKTVRAPDVAFLARAEWPPGAITDGFLPGAPTLAVEVVSPRDQFSEVVAKAEAWLAAGSREVWAVDPRLRLVMVFAGGLTRILHADDTVDADGLLPGLRFMVERIFR